MRSARACSHHDSAGRFPGSSTSTAAASRSGRSTRSSATCAAPTSVRRPDASSSPSTTGSRPSTGSRLPSRTATRGCSGSLMKLQQLRHRPGTHRDRRRVCRRQPGSRGRPRRARPRRAADRAAAARGARHRPHRRARRFPSFSQFGKGFGLDSDVQGSMTSAYLATPGRCREPVRIAAARRRSHRASLERTS